MTYYLYIDILNLKEEFMKYYQLISTIKFPEDVDALNVNEIISQKINRCFLNSEKYKGAHKINQFKNYVFSMPYPIEKSKRYSKDKYYCFNLRCLDLDMAIFLKSHLSIQPKGFKLISAEIKTFYYKAIAELQSLSSVILTATGERKYVSKNLIDAGQLIHNNLVKKMQSLIPDYQPPAELFFEVVEKLNAKPVAVGYKNIKLLGDKYNLLVKQDECSQKLAFLGLAIGIGERNSTLGCGYCKMK